VGFIKSQDEIAIDEARRRATAVVKQFRQAVRPIYRPHRNALTHVGTCTLLELQGVRLVVTAAHIIDQHAPGLWIGGESTAVPLIGEFLRTIAPSEDRNLDKHDFAASIVTDEFAATLGNVGYVASEYMIKRPREIPPATLFAAVGYPNSKNKDIHVTKREASVRLWMHIGAGKSRSADLDAWAATTNEHLFLTFDKYASNLDGTKRTSTNPKGTSGGPIFHLGNFGDPETYRADQIFTPRLEAIVVERSTKARVLIGVKVGAIIAALQKAEVLPALD
jgi:hypothetical protein